jgi:AmmeMemoRadiSam system protein B
MARNIRPAAVAGTWYPGTAMALAAAVDNHLTLAGEAGGDLAELKALVVPHAGLKYSGPVAAHAYGLLRGRQVDVVFLVGPSHFVGFEGVAVYRGAGFDTPLGIVDVDADCAAALAAATPLVREHDVAHAREHSLEMQLPFLRRVAPGARIVPLVMGWQDEATAAALAEALVHGCGEAAGGRRTLLVASTDLSHFHDAATAGRLDGIVVDHVSRLDVEGLQRVLNLRPEHACGGGPLVAVMRAALRLGAHDAAILSYADSGDVSGDKSSVVGYLAAALGVRAGRAGVGPLRQ